MRDEERNEKNLSKPTLFVELKCLVLLSQRRLLDFRKGDRRSMTMIWRAYSLIDIAVDEPVAQNVRD